MSRYLAERIIEEWQKAEAESARRLKARRLRMFYLVSAFAVTWAAIIALALR